MKFFIFIQILFGFCFFIRILYDFSEKKLLNKSTLTKIGTLYAVYLCLGVKILTQEPMFLCFWIHFPGVFSQFWEFLLRNYRNTQFRKEFLFYLSNIILNMRSGNSFRDSLSLSNHENNVLFQKNMDEIINIVAFSQQFDRNKQNKFVLEVINELKATDQQPHRAIERLKNFKRKLQIESDFRRRSGQLLQQTRAQSLILTGLYLALVIFTAFRFGFAENFKLILLSTLLFAVGLITVFSLGRKIKWTV